MEQNIITYYQIGLDTSFEVIFYDLCLLMDTPYSLKIRIEDMPNFIFNYLHGGRVIWASISNMVDHGFDYPGRIIIPIS